MQFSHALYCSELVAWAFEQAGLPIADLPKSGNVPKDVPKSADLVYVGHVKAEI